MAGLTAASGLAAALRTQAAGELMDEVFRYQDLLRRFDTAPWMGGSTWDVKHHYAGNTVSSYSEGDPPPTAVAQSYATAQWPETHYHGTVKITGHAMDYTRNGSDAAVFFDIISAELVETMKDLASKVEYDCLGSGLGTGGSPVGILGIVDSTWTIAGLDRATYTWFASIENAGAATTLAIGDMDKLVEELTSNKTSAGVAIPGRPAKPNIGFMEHKQMRKCRNIGFLPGSNSTQVSVSVANGQAPTVQLGFNTEVLYYSGIPFYPVLGFSQSDIVAGERETMKLLVCRNWKVDTLGKADDSDTQYITGAFGLANKRPRTWGKITTLTA